MEDRLLTTTQVAEWLQIHEETVRRWLRDGELAGINLGRKGGWRIRERDVVAYLERREQTSKNLAESNPGEVGCPSPGRTGEATERIVDGLTGNGHRLHARLARGTAARS